MEFGEVVANANSIYIGGDKPRTVSFIVRGCVSENELFYFWVYVSFIFLDEKFVNFCLGLFRNVCFGVRAIGIENFIGGFV